MESQFEILESTQGGSVRWFEKSDISQVHVGIFCPIFLRGVAMQAQSPPTPPGLQEIVLIDNF